MSSPRLPFHAPRWLTPNRLGAGVVAAGAALLTGPAIRVVYGPGAFAMYLAPHGLPREGAALAAPGAGGAAAVELIVVLLSAALSYLLARRALAETSPRKAAAWCVFGAFFGGAVALGLSLALVALLTGRLLMVLPALFGGALVGTALVSPLGLCFGALYALLAAPLKRVAGAASHDGAERAMRWSGAWLAVAGLVGARLAAAQAGPLAGPFAALGAAAFAAGLLLFDLALAGHLLRLAWLAKVAVGRAPGFVITPAEEGEAAAPFLYAGEGASYPLALRRAALPGAPYRAAEDAPLALLPALRPAPALALLPPLALGLAAQLALALLFF
jgi:hypothetical protein